MNEGSAWALIQRTLELGLIVCSPLLLAITAVGLMTSIAQALTQLQEQTVGFVLKTATTLLGLYFLGPWILHRLSENLQHVLLALGEP